jgi:uncharacterized membrane protein YkoI
MTVKRRYLIVSGAVLALAGGGAGTAVALSGDDGGDHKGAKGPAAQRATDAALAITGGGEANAVERDGENGATWEVEVTKPNGQTVDVRLDQNYRKVVVESDQED